MKFIPILIIIFLSNLIIDNKCEKYIGIFKISNSFSMKQNRIKYRHTLLCAIECLKTKDCNMVHIRDKKCEIQVNCPYSNSSENDGILLENASRKNDSIFRGKQNYQKNLMIIKIF